MVINILIPCLLVKYAEVDDAMIRAALTPLSDSQQECSLWLDKYFTVNGDHVPNSNEIRLSISTKKDLWQLYCHELQRESNFPRSFVSYSIFVTIWNVLYPYCPVNVTPVTSLTG